MVPDVISPFILTVIRAFYCSLYWEAAVAHSCSSRWESNTESLADPVHFKSIYHDKITQWNLPKIVDCN